MKKPLLLAVSYGSLMQRGMWLLVPLRGCAVLALPVALIQRRNT